MKFFTQIMLILSIFLQTGNLLSDSDLFNVNNILLEKKDNTQSKQLANRAKKEAFNQLTKRILLKEDYPKVSDLSSESVRELVKYYKISKNPDEDKNKISFSITFDKDKIHDLFYEKGISYSDISDKDFYILPILLNENEIFVFSNNYFYENWSLNSNDELIEFILPLENIEVIQNINQFKNNLLNLEINNLLKEYQNKNVALVLIDNNKINEKKIYLKTRIQGKIISKNLKFKRENLTENRFNEKIVLEIKDEIINLVKSQNLIDIRIPSFLNVKFNLNKKNNLVLLNSRIKNIDLIENIFVQEFNKDYVNLKIKYLGKLEKIINQLNYENISLQLVNDEWLIKAL